MEKEIAVIKRDVINSLSRKELWCEEYGENMNLALFIAVENNCVDVIKSVLWYKLVQPEIYGTVLGSLIDAEDTEMFLVLAECGEPFYNGRKVAFLRAKRAKWFRVAMYLKEDVEDTLKIQKILRESLLSNDVELVKHIVKKGLDKIDLNFQSETVAFFAYHGNVEMVEYIIEHGYDIRKETLNNYRIVASAIESENIEVIKSIINKCGNNKKRYDYILKNATIRGRLEIIKWLQEKNDIYANIDMMLIEAVKYKQHGVIQYLLEHGADIHANHEEALITAVEKGYLETVKYLVEHGADIHACNENALAIAVQTQRLEMIEYLTEQGADAYMMGEILLGAAEKGRIQIVIHLIKHGTDIHKVAKRLIKLAIKNGDFILLKIVELYCLNELMKFPDKSEAGDKLSKGTELVYKYLRLLKAENQ